jgi:hypothetical protein
MLIKAADDKQPQIEGLNAMLGRPDVDAPTRKLIEQEIRTVRAGAKGERDAAYEIDFHYRDRDSYMVIHDLRIEFGGRVAQIDHLLINRVLDVWVCETKAFSEGVKIDEYGEWYRYGWGRAHGMASPVEQNRRHIAVLEDVFEKGPVTLPRRVVRLKPSLVPVVLVSNDARIDRPKGKNAARVDGLDTVIKVEKLVRTIERRFDERNVVGMVSKLVSAHTIERIARELAAMHAPATFDWAAKFGLPPAPTIIEPTLVETSSDAAGSSSPVATAACASCGRPVSDKVAAFSREHVHRFGGQVLCWDCQRKSRRRPTNARA